MKTNELSKLTPEQKRIKIAELTGFRWSVTVGSEGNVYIPTRFLVDCEMTSVRACREDEMELPISHSPCVFVPDYLGSLDAMARALKKLDADDLREFAEVLEDRAGGTLGAIVSDPMARGDALLLAVGARS